jgi:hypothetical protein
MIVYVCFVYLIQLVIQILHPCYKQTKTSIENESLPTPPYIESHIPQKKRKNLLQNNGYCLHHRKHTHSDKIIVSLHRTKNETKPTHCSRKFDPLNHHQQSQWFLFSRPPHTTCFLHELELPLRERSRW